MNDHGLRESQAVTAAAQELSAARKHLAYINRYTWNTEKHKQDAEDRLIAAKAAYDAAFKLYTNPFNVTKTFS